MWWTLFVLLVGLFIGWNIPQPDWAKALQSTVKDKLSNK